MVNQLKEFLFNSMMNVLVVFVIIPLFYTATVVDKIHFNIKKKYYDKRKIRYIVCTGTFGPYLIKY